MIYLLDINVLSELAEPRPDEGVLARFDETANDGALAAFVSSLATHFGLRSRQPSAAEPDA